MAATSNDPHDPSAAECQAILDSISEGVFTVDRDWRIRSFNRAAEAITSIPRDEALGRRCSEVFRSSMCGRDCGLRRTLESGRPLVGLTGYIIDAEGSRIPVSVSTAVLRDATGAVVGGAETFRDLREVEALRFELQGRYRVGELVSRSPLMQRVFEVLPAIAASTSSVLILGETGTGKELLARTIHALSPRAKGPFVAVNCGALPETLLESELFGYKAGAFTGAVRDKPGRFALARGGTILLDEIAEVSPAMQVRLLRVLQERAYEPLGGTATETADVRVVAASNQDLGQAMRQGRFREDLYYRVNVVRLELPPLRRRKEDIPLLAESFIEHFNALQHKDIQGLSAEALSLVMLHDWPGNVRELHNVIERAFILCDHGDIEIRHLPPELTTRREPGSGARDMRSRRHALDARMIREALARTDGNRLLAARDLGIHKSTLYRAIRRLGLTLPPGDGRSADKDRE